MIQKISVKPRKIKSIIFNSNNLKKLGKSTCSQQKQQLEKDQHTHRSQLKSFSQQRNLHQFKLVSTSKILETIRSEIIENIQSLQEILKYTSSYRCLRGSTISKVIPHSKIDLRKTQGQYPKMCQSTIFSKPNIQVITLQRQQSKRKQKRRKGINLCKIKATQLYIR